MTSNEENQSATPQTPLPQDALRSVAPESFTPESVANELWQLRQSVAQLKSDLQQAVARASFYEEQAASIQGILQDALRVAFEIRQNARRQSLETSASELEVRTRLLEEIASLTAERDRIRSEVSSLRLDLTSFREQTSSLADEKQRIRQELDALVLRLRGIRESVSVDEGGNEGGGEGSNEAGTKAGIEAGDGGQGQLTDNQAAGQEAGLAREDKPRRAHAPARVTGSDAPAAPPVPAKSDDPIAGMGEAVDELLRAASTTIRLPGASAEKGNLGLLDLVVSRPLNEIEVTVAPLHGFPKLVEFERALHELDEIKNFYVRDFRHGTAKLAIILKDTERQTELISHLESLAGWRTSVTQPGHSRIDVKIED